MQNKIKEDLNAPIEKKEFCKECGFSGWIIGQKEKDRSAFRCSCSNGQKLSGKIATWNYGRPGWVNISPPIFDKFEKMEDRWS